jgi:hypothetical protein
MAERRFPPPWTVETLNGGFKTVDANKQAIPMFTATPISTMLNRQIADS